MSAVTKIWIPALSWKILRSCTHKGSTVDPFWQIFQLFGRSLCLTLRCLRLLGWKQLPKQGASWELAGFGSSFSTIPELPLSLRALQRLSTDPAPLLCLFPGYWDSLVLFFSSLKGFYSSAVTFKLHPMGHPGCSRLCPALQGFLAEPIFPSEGVSLQEVKETVGI